MIFKFILSFFKVRYLLKYGIMNEKYLLNFKYSIMCNLENFITNYLNNGVVTSEKEVLHLWYSEKQKEVAGSCIGKLVNGEEVIYTEATIGKQYTSLWDDVVYLGEGEYKCSQKKH
jgi:hypothetical protein